jgi:hypothetical protein
MNFRLHGAPFRNGVWNGTGWNYMVNFFEQSGIASSSIEFYLEVNI